jgi:hypothetical protein
VISTGTAIRLRDAGLAWDPAPGDRFTVLEPEMLGENFVLSDMTIEVQDFPTGRVLGFNGTTEWALDSVAHEAALWLPREDQLRERLGAAFRSLARHEGGYRVAVRVDGTERVVQDASAAEAYGAALLLLLGTVPS